MYYNLWDNLNISVLWYLWNLYADIPVPILQVPAGKEQEPGGLPNFLKEEEKVEYNEEKEKDDEEKEEDSFMHFPSSYTSKSCGNAFWRGESILWETERNRVHLCNVCDKEFKALPMHNQHIIWQHIGHVLICKGCGKKFHTNIGVHRHKKLLLVGQGPPSRRLSLIWT